MLEILGVNELVEDERPVMLRDALAQQFRSGEVTVPPVPRLALELNKLVANPDIGVATDLAQRDPQLAGRVVHVASSPIFGFAAPPADLRGAVVRLGVNGLRDIATLILMKRQFHCPELEERAAALLGHSFVVASGSAKIFSLLGEKNRDAFLAGLMHDVGRNLVLYLLGELALEDRGWLDDDVVDLCMGSLHTDAGGLVCTRWELPEAIRDVARHHHDRGEPIVNRTLVAAVALADKASHIYDETKEHGAAVANEAEAEELGLSQDACCELAHWIIQAREDAVVKELTRS